MSMVGKLRGRMWKTWALVAAMLLVLLLPSSVLGMDKDKDKNEDEDKDDPTVSPLLEGPPLNETKSGQKIQGGSEAERGRYPYVARLRTIQFERHICGGVLVEPDLVVTAAHCVDTRSANDAEPLPKVVIGGIEREDDPEAVEFESCRTIVPKSYNGLAEDGHDIALLELDRPADGFEPVEISRVRDTDLDGVKMTAVGWGKQCSTCPLADVLLEATGLVFIRNEACNEPEAYDGIIQNTMICALGITGDACDGDSGGPLIWNDPTANPPKDFLMGVVSFGVPEDCLANIPTVYTRASEFVSWIRTRGDDSDIILNNPNCAGSRPPPESVVTPAIEDVEPPTADEVISSIKNGLDGADELVLAVAKSPGGSKVLVDVAEGVIVLGLAQEAAVVFITADSKIDEDQQETVKAALADATSILFRELAIEEISKQIINGEVEDAGLAIAKVSNDEEQTEQERTEQIEEAIKVAINNGSTIDAGLALIKAVEAGGNKEILGPANDLATQAIAG